MKRIIAMCCLLCILTGCSKQDRYMEQALQLREQLLHCECCTFQAEITADYGDQLHRFVVDCRGDREGNLQFTVLEPESISGITGEIHALGGRLTFSDTAIGFPMMADEMLSPVSAPWVLLKSLCSGYMHACGKTEQGIRMTVFDSYDEDALQLDIWTDQQCVPNFAEILWKGKRILSLKIDNFLIL